MNKNNLFYYIYYVRKNIQICAAILKCLLADLKTILHGHYIIASRSSNRIPVEKK